MKNNLIVLSVVALLSSCAQTEEPVRLTQFVDPFVGTAYVGHTHPAASLPFSMIQVGPDTGVSGWEYCAGYRNTDTSVMGFSHTHLSGTGAADMGDIMIMPVTGEVKFDAGSLEDPDSGYRSRFSKANEEAAAGYYKTVLDDYKVIAEMTLTPRVGMHRYTYAASDKAGVIIDLAHGIADETYESNIRVIDQQTIAGVRKSKGFVSDHGWYFIAQFSKPFDQCTVWQDSTVMSANEAKGEKVKMHVGFKTTDAEVVVVKIAMSTTGEEGALKNLKAEMPSWDFDEVRADADKTWNDYLSKVTVEAMNDDQRVSFYTCLYHALLMPNLITDVDGQYQGWDHQLHQSTEGDLYTNFSLWDTYRALHPYLALICPEKNSQFVKSMLQKHRQTGLLPTNEYGICETWCMIGNHAVEPIVDAYLKGDRSFDADLAYEAVKHAMTVDHNKSEWTVYNKYGYFPYDILKTDETVSRTMEACYEDYSVALMAQKMGKDEDYKFFMNRANNFKNLFDPKTQLARAHDSKGKCREPFHSFALINETGDRDYTEGNAWQWTWHVQHDPEGLIGLFDSKENFVNKLDSLYFIDVDEIPGIVEIPDVTGLIGLYAHGNEPSHHIAYLYTYADRPDKTADIVRHVFDNFYMPTDDGVCGNDDCGQMSAWYLFSGMGFYPLNPVSGEYVLGAPQLHDIKVQLPNGQCFEMKANGLSAENKYVKAIRLNGQPVQGNTITYDEIMKGGVLEFDMTSQL